MLSILFMTVTSTLLLLTKKTMMWKSFPPILFLTTLVALPTMYTPLTSKTLSLFMMKDPLNTSLVILSLWITALMFLASSKVNNFSPSSKSFSFWVLLLLIALMFSFSTNNLLTFYIMFESSLIPILILILGWGYQPERLQASFYLLLYTIAASLPLLIAILMMSSNTGHLYMFMKWTPLNLSNNLTMVWWAMMNVAFMVKLPLFLAHLWLPKAHVEAPVAGSMILAAVLLKLGGYGLIQMSLLFPPPSTLMPTLIMSIALWGAVISSLICLRQTDLKALIAYSSVSHMGLLIAGLMSFSSLGTFGATFMMIAHGLCSSALFSIANMTYESTNTRSLYITKGLALASPYMALWWFLLSATNMATPPSINLFSEILLLTSALSFAPLSWLFLALVSFLSAAYSLYMYTASQHGPSPQFSNPLSTYAPSNHTTLLLHLLPIILLIAKPDIILS